MFLLQGNLPPFCLARNATKTGNTTIGMTLKVDVWEENVFGFQIRYLIAPNPRFGVPVNMISKGGARDSSSWLEWWDFQVLNFRRN
jgi:hypothetical protein